MKNVIIYFLIVCFQRFDWLISRVEKRGGGLKKKIFYIVMLRIYVCKINILIIDVVYMVEDKIFNLGLWVILGVKCNRW